MKNIVVFRQTIEIDGDLITVDHLSKEEYQELLNALDKMPEFEKRSRRSLAKKLKLELGIE